MIGSSHIRPMECCPYILIPFKFDNINGQGFACQISEIYLFKLLIFCFGVAEVNLQIKAFFYGGEIGSQVDRDKVCAGLTSTSHCILDLKVKCLIAKFFVKLKFHGSEIRLGHRRLGLLGILGILGILGVLAVGITVTAQIDHIAVIGIAVSITAHEIVPVGVVDHALRAGGCGVIDGKTLDRRVVHAVSASDIRQVVKIVRIVFLIGTPVVQMASLAFELFGEISNLSIGGVHIGVEDILVVFVRPVVPEALVGQEMTVGIVLEGFDGGALAQHAFASPEIILNLLDDIVLVGQPLGADILFPLPVRRPQKIILPGFQDRRYGGAGVTRFETGNFIGGHDLV